MQRLLGLASVAAVAGAMIATPAAAVNVAQYLQFQSTQNTLQFVNSGASYTLSSLPFTPARQVVVSITDPATNISNIGLAKLTFTATGTGPLSITGLNFDLPFATGSLSLTAVGGPIMLGAKSVTNILSFTFTDAVMTGQLGSRSPTFTASLPDSSFGVVSSDFLTGPVIDLANFSLSMSNASAALTPASGKLPNFVAASTGTFALVPEPATWGLMIAGFGMVGLARRRRRIAIAA